MFITKKGKIIDFPTNLSDREIFIAWTVILIPVEFRLLASFARLRIHSTCSEWETVLCGTGTKQHFTMRLQRDWGCKLSWLCVHSACSVLGNTYITAHLLLLPTVIVCAKVMFSIMSVCLSTKRNYHVTTTNPLTYCQVGGWHSFHFCERNQSNDVLRYERFVHNSQHVKEL